MASYFKRGLLIFLGGLLVVSSCRKAESEEESTEAEAPVQVSVPAFSADSAYAHIAKQVGFGPRVPGTPAQQKCADWMTAKFQSYGYPVVQQKFDALLYNGRRVPGINVIASYRPEVSKRIVLAAHWDTRPYSDKDAGAKNVPIDGANDGGSGVGVLLEVARHLVQDSAQVGVDFVLFDVEDWGAPDSYTGDLSHTTYGGWCLGSEHWSKNPHKPGYTASYGVLLDMVGAADARFYHEGYSFQYAPSIVSKVWSTASQLGFGTYFPNTRGGVITDDHVPVNEFAKIPMIDVVDYRMDASGGGFFPHHHTVADKMDAIDKQTLKAVGQTVLHVLYHER